MDNAAFEDDDELASILRHLANRIGGQNWLPDDDLKVRDANGNTVGSVLFSEVPTFLMPE